MSGTVPDTFYRKFVVSDAQAIYIDNTKQALQYLQRAWFFACLMAAIVALFSYRLVEQRTNETVGDQELWSIPLLGVHTNAGMVASIAYMLSAIACAWAANCAWTARQNLRKLRDCEALAASHAIAIYPSLLVFPHWWLRLLAGAAPWLLIFFALSSIVHPDADWFSSTLIPLLLSLPHASLIWQFRHSLTHVLTTSK